MNEANAIAVSTVDTREAILEANNSAAWKLNIGKWRGRLEWLVCMRKEGTKRRPFLLCRISSIRLRDDATEPQRYAIEFDSYADLPPDIPLMEGTQFPVRYGDLEAFNIDLDKVDLQPAPEKTRDYSYSCPNTSTNYEQNTSNITIAEAKRMLATSLGIKEDQIEITITA